MREVLGVVGLVVLVCVGALLVSACIPADNAATRRANAEAAEVRAGAEAYQVRQQADTQAAAERANTRQMERDAANQRSLTTLPFVLAIGGGVLVLVLGLIGGYLAWQNLQIERAKIQYIGPSRQIAPPVEENRI